MSAENHFFGLTKLFIYVVLLGFDYKKMRNVLLSEWINSSPPGQFHKSLPCLLPSFH